MATLEFFIFFTLFFFFLPHIACKKCHQYESKCKNSDHNDPIVHFPFRLKGHQPQRCGYSNSFDLSCNEKKQTVLTLPSSSEKLIVNVINYGEQSLWIHDQNKCILKRMLDNDFTLAGSPFHFDTAIVNYTFFSCTPQAPILFNYLPIDCLSSENNKIIAMESSSLTSPPSSCDVIFTAMLPFVDSYELHDPDSGVRLAWGAPNCRSCESTGRVCGFKNVRNKQVHCSPSPATDHGSSYIFPYGLKFPRLILCFGAPELMLITGLVLYILTFIRDRVKPPQRMTELSVLGNEQPHVVITGLDDLTIESYPTTQLGERWEFPKPDDSACPICLCEYKSEDTLRFIPECDHHFHADCIDEWLRKNKTCPVCRITPPENDKTTLALLRHDRMSIDYSFVFLNSSSRITLLCF